MKRDEFREQCELSPVQAAGGEVATKAPKLPLTLDAFVIEVVSVKPPSDAGERSIASRELLINLLAREARSRHDARSHEKTEDAKRRAA